jgi:hypothetical protein
MHKSLLNKKRLRMSDKKIQVSIRLISQEEYGEQITQEDFDELLNELHSDNFVRIGNSIVPTNRIEIIYQEQ